MLKVVIDTNVLLVANQQHADVSTECVASCIERLQAIQNTGVVVIDDSFIILGEYQHKTCINPPRGVGDVFLKWLLRNMGNPAQVEMVSVTLTDIDLIFMLSFQIKHYSMSLIRLIVFFQLSPMFILTNQPFCRRQIVSGLIGGQP